MKTLLVSICCLLGAATAGYYLYQDMNSVGGHARGESIALIFKSENRVRRKSSESFVWSKARVGEMLYHRDSVQTSSNSSTTIRYHDGSLVDVGEDSLVVIDDPRNLALTYGSLLVERPDGSDSEISLGADGKKHVRSLSVRLNEPELHDRFFMKADQSFFSTHFAWRFLKKFAGGEKIVLEIATDSKFKHLQQRIDVSKLSQAPHPETSVKLQPGQYFWRLSATAGDIPMGALSEAAPFSIASVRALKPLWPNASENVLTLGESEIQFRWKIAGEMEHEGKHRIEIARDSSFERVLFRDQVDPSTGSASLSHIFEGHYFWRLASQYGNDSIAVMSSPEEFTVDNTPRIAIDLVGPENQSTFDKTKPVRFTWKANADQVQFIWEFEHEGTASLTQSLTASGLVFYPDRAHVGSGLRRWRVKAVNSDGKVLGTSDWRFIAFYDGLPIALQTPAALEKIYYWKAPGEAKFAWQMSAPTNGAPAPASSFRIDVASDVDFKTILGTRTTSKFSLPLADLVLKDGQYFWRVTEVDAQGDALRGSTPRSFSYGVHPLLEASKEIEPVDASTYSILERDFDAVLSWTQVEGAQGYEVSIYHREGDSSRTPASNRTPVIRQVVHGTELRVQRLRAGEYEWVVRPIDQIERRGQPSVSHSLKVIFGDTLGAPESLTPEVQ